MQSLLNIDGVGKNFGDFKVLKGISFKVPKGSIFGLLGPNGAGKTTLIRIITQITAPDVGTVYFDQQNMQASDVLRIGYLPEERGLYRKMKVWDQALYLTQLKGLDKREATASLSDWFKRFDMHDWHNKRVDSLSKGMQQKLQFVISVAHQPDLLILDEPFSGFDPVNTEKVKQEILRLREQGTTILFSTHNMASVEELCEEIALINKGECVLSGRVDDIKSSFSKSLYEIEFSGSSVAFANSLGIDFEIAKLQSHGENHRVLLKAHNGKSAGELLKRIVGSMEITSFREQLPSMHDIFLDRVEPRAESPLSSETDEK